MYPFVRLVKEMTRFRRAEPLPLLGTHVSTLICWPWDLDFWMELNNGRTLTLYDLGRMPLAARTGLLGTMKRHNWGIVVAGNTTRYRKRVTAFQRFEMRSRCIGWDERFIYMEQAMYRGGECTSHMLLRGAVTKQGKLLPTVHLLEAMGEPVESPPLPDWVTAWTEADAKRPWPPEI